MSTEDKTVADQLKSIWMHAVTCYEKGNHDANTYFDADQTRFLTSIGVQPFEVFDFAEDYVLEGVPSFDKRPPKK